MRQRYEIPPGCAEHLNIGQWVEIFEAYGDVGGTGEIRVKSMRVEGRRLRFAAERPEEPGARALRPHEGRVVFVEEGERATRFGIRLSS